MAKKNDVLKKKIEKKAEAVKEVKGEEAVVESEKVTVAEEPKKITAKAAPKRISAKEAPKKITAKEEPKKIAAKAAPKKLENKTEPKKEAAVEEVKEAPIAAEIKKPRGRKAKAVAEEVKAEPVKKTTKAKAKEEVKAETKAKPAKKTVKKAVKEEDIIVEEVKEDKTKKPVKRPAKKVVVEEAVLPFTVEEGIQKMNAMNIFYTFDEYHRILIENETITKAIEAIVEECKLVDFDRSVLEVLYSDLVRRVDVKTSDFKAMKKTLEEIMSRKTTSFEEDSQLYHDAFYFAGKMLEYGERFKMSTTEQLKAWIGVDMVQYFNFYMDMALKVLPEWADKDVDNYDDFMSEVCTQFTDLCAELEFRFQIDLADIQIAHGFYNKGDSSFEYLLRENEIKDYIYYRYAHAYVDVNLDKAKWIANRAFTVVDKRYVYYPLLVEIANR